MPYTSRSIDFDDSPTTAPPDCSSSPRYKRTTTAQDCARREDDGEGGRTTVEDSEDESESGEGNGGSSSAHSNSVQKAMAKQTRKRVNPPTKRLVLDSIVVSHWKDIRPNGPNDESTVPSTSRVQDVPSSSAQREKTENIKPRSVQRTYLERRTIKPIKGLHTSGLKRKRSPTRLEIDRSRTSSPIPPPNDDDDGDASSDYDSSSDVLLLTGRPSRASSSRDVEKYSSPSSSSPPPPNTKPSSSRPRPTLPVSHRDNEPKTKPSKTSKGSDFYASLSNAYNFARQCVLEKKPTTTRRPEKSQPSRSQSTLSLHPLEPSRSIQVQSKSTTPQLQSTSQSCQPSSSSLPTPPVAHQRFASKPRQTFAFVLIPPPLFPVPRERYRSISELEVDEEEDVHEREKAKEIKDREVREERPKQGVKRKRGRPPKRSPDKQFRDVAEHSATEEESEQEEEVKQREGSRQGILLKRKPGRPPKRSLERQAKKKEEKTGQEVIYVSSDSEAPVAGPSKRAPTSSTRTFSRFRNHGVERDDTIVVNSSTRDDCFPSSSLVTRRTGTEDESSSPKPTAKRTRKRKRVERVISESPSDSESEFDVEAIEAALLNAHPDRRSTPPLGQIQSIQSPDLLQPLSTKPKSVASSASATSIPIVPECATKAGKKRRTETDNDSTTTEPYLDEVADGISPNRDIEKTVDNSRSTFETSQHNSSSSPAPPSREIVVQHQAPAKDVHDRRHHHSPSMRQRSPMLHPSSSRSPSSRSVTLTEQVDPSYSPSDSPNTDGKSRTLRVGAPTKVAGINSHHEMDDDLEEEEEDRDDKDDELGLESEDEVDDVCHYCRSRNVYAKMKCTNMKANGVCPLHYCHRCCAKFFPKIHFDPFSGTFVCPSCDDTCSCKFCCRRRRVPEPRKPPQARLKYYELGPPLLLSAQETRREERRKQLKAAGRPDLAKLVGQNQQIKRRPRPKIKVHEAGDGRDGEKGRRKVDIGEDAEEWFKQRRLERAKQFSGKTTTTNDNSVGRAFVGSWSRAWGPAPGVIHEMDGVDVDVHAVNGMGKGKAKCVDQGRRLYAGDPKGLFRPFVCADDVVFTKSESKPKPDESLTKQSPVRSLNPPPSEVIHDSIIVTSGPRKKRRRVGNPITPIDSITIPQFTINHQETSATALSSTDLSSQPTPDDFLGPPEIVDGDGDGDNTNAYLRYPRIVNDPMLSGVGDTSDGLGYGPTPVSGFWNENGIEMADGNIKEMNAYAPDWDSLGPTTNKKAEPSTTLFGDGEAEPEFSYDGVYDEYAAALGITREGESMFNRERRVSQELPVIKMGGGSTTTNASRDGPSKASGTPADVASIVDPALLAQSQQQQSTSHPTSSHSRANSNSSPTSPSEPDPSRFLTVHALSSTDFISAPMIYGIPSSTGLSLDDLERTVREAVSTVGTGADGCE
ncbi:uncharacterized protein FOMMEDRAFT_159287 [Fomitiporia mediterranea MF3/22]|uniref:uncharacterized protein n=1 Tax=Fomitiporia mediterranea (strain MF3/22) TaxID=694068 RepID=UPI0004408F1A|nr:uncharacterized protein FOMMEDRAFT_159287 [Fomitiporia mediterranea MF3/22]EJD00551.1 hypothetical protein FOMMEDRAFT_159287 [Fomitiporia mediterranea MF3/22]